MIKAAFFDIDGTLVSFKTHRMPESTKRALAALRAAGVRTYVASGRPSYQLPPCVRSGFDGYVTMNGQLCYDETGTFLSNPIDPADVRAVAAQVRRGLYDVLVLRADRAVCSGASERVRAVERVANVEYEIGDIGALLDEPVYQMCAFVGPQDDGLVTGVAPHVKTARWTDLFCDVLPATGGKPEGVAAALARAGIAPEEAMAFGDGGNDVGMLEYVGCGVAMGNGNPEAKLAADHVTDSVDDDGIWNACVRLGVVSGA